MTKEKTKMIFLQHKKGILTREKINTNIYSLTKKLF